MKKLIKEADPEWCLNKDMKKLFSMDDICNIDLMD